MNIDARAKKGEQIKVLCVKESIYYIMHKHKYSFQRAFIHSDGVLNNIQRVHCQMMSRRIYNCTFGKSCGHYTMGGGGNIVFI